MRERKNIENSTFKCAKMSVSILLSAAAAAAS